MALYHILLLFALLFLTQFSESRLTQELFKKAFNTPSSKSNDEEGTMWAVLVAGSNGYENYRHQADICHAYQILKRGGLSDENIIVFMYDDIAYNEANPRPGTIINSPNGEDVYQGVPKDYTGESVTASNVIAAILGNGSASGKAVNSGPNDRIFIYYSDHGGPGVLSMPDGNDLYAQDFINTLQEKYQMGTYKSMVIYVEACEAGSIFDGLLSDKMNIYVTTASNPTENSYATYCSSQEFNTCLGDLFSVSWMEDSDSHGTLSETLEQQYEVVKERTLAGGDEGSHVMQYGDKEFTSYPLSVYMGSSSTDAYLNQQHNTVSSNSVEQHEADILYLKQKVLRAPEGSMKKHKAQKDLEDALSYRRHIDHTFEEIGKALFGQGNGIEILKTIRSPGQPIVDDWDCFKTLANTYKARCGLLSTYGKKHMRAFANMCNVGVKQVEFAEVATKVCGNKLN